MSTVTLETFNASDVAAGIVERTLRDGGATYSRVHGFLTEAPADGARYVVGGAAPAYVVPKAELRSEHVAYMVGIAFSHGRAVGTWVDGDQVYVDVVDILNDRGRALQLASERGELAIFDLHAFEEISTRRAA